jgi:hypothetical protein
VLTGTDENVRPLQRRRRNERSPKGTSGIPECAVDLLAEVPRDPVGCFGGSECPLLDRELVS